MLMMRTTPHPSLPQDEQKYPVTNKDHMEQQESECTHYGRVLIPTVHPSHSYPTECE